MRSKTLLAFLRTGAEMGWYTIFKVKIMDYHFTRHCLADVMFPSQLVDAAERWPDIQEQDQTVSLNAGKASTP